MTKEKKDASVTDKHFLQIVLILLNLYHFFWLARHIRCEFQRAEDANKLEENQEHELLENSYVKFEIDNEKMREYHVDANPKLNTYPKTLSFWRDLSSTRPIMMIDQD